MLGVIGRVDGLSVLGAANDARFRRMGGQHGAPGDMRAVVSVMQALFPDAGCRRMAAMLGLAKSTVQGHVAALVHAEQCKP